MAQFRVLKATVQRMYGVVIRPHDLITGWMLRHATWLITRYLTHADGLTSYQRRWDRQFSSPLCVFGETVQTKLSVKRANKYEGDWKTGIWLGRDSETNEHLIALDSGVIRSRTVRRFPEPEQYQLQVYRAMKGTLWNLRTDNGNFQNAADFQPRNTFPLPAFDQQQQPATSGPTGADASVDTDNTAQTTKTEGEDMDIDSETVQSTSHIAPSTSKRVPDADALSEPKRLRIAILANIRLKTGKVVEAVVNEDTFDYDMRRIAELARHEKLDPEKTLKGMKIEITAMTELDVYDVISLPEVPHDSQLIGVRWVLKEKADEVRARLVAQGYNQELAIDQETYASTPQLTTLKFLLASAVSRNLFIKIGDISTAFLHASLDHPVYCKAPEEIYGPGKALRLKRALYGLKNSPLLWQEHLPQIPTELNFERMKTDANLYLY